MRTRSIIAASTAAAVLTIGLAACGSDDTSSSSSSSDGAKYSGSITGAGATFPAPVYSEWAANLKEQGLGVNYQAIGSGGGIAQFTAGTVDFGATDSAMDDDEFKEASKKGDPVHVPTVFGAVTASYNVTGVDTGLKLDGETLADIYLGKVKTWNDAAITALNPDAKLPDTAITVCHRSDESGTTKLFTTFLAAYSKAWESGRASTSPSTGRPVPARRATTASPRASSRPTAPSATSRRPTRCRTTSRRPTSRTRTASSSPRRSKPPPLPALP